MAFGDDDLGVFFSDAGVAVQFGSQLTRGNLDEAGVTGQVVGLTVDDASHVLEIGRGSLNPMPRSGSALQVDGRAFVVRGLTPVDDGAVIRIEMKASKA